MTVTEELRAQRRLWRRLFLQAILVTLFLGAMAIRWAPHPAPATLAVYLVLTVAIVIRPVVGVYAVTALTLAGDAAVAGWYPFAKNFSSRESISFISDSLTITPIELVLGVTAAAWLLSMYRAHSWTFRRGALDWPMVAFGAIVLLALGRAMVGAGNNRIAIFEGRAMVYLPVLYLLIAQVVRTRRQYVLLFISALLGLFVHSLIALEYYTRLGVDVRAELEGLAEHAASVHLAAIVVMLLASWCLRGCSLGLRVALVLLAGPGIAVFLLSQRRSGAVALGVGVIMLVVVLGKVRPRILLVVVPLLVLSTTAYLVAFWNATGVLGMGSTAFKSVFAPDQLERVDQSSSLYREIEAFDLWYTIHASPLTGVGFGNPFYQPARLPHLEGFEFRHYIPHNSLLWVWLKLGVVGFVVTLFLFARTVQRGARSAVRGVGGDRAVLMIGAVSYVVMYAVFAYVDIAWDARSMVFLAIAAAWCGDFLDAEPDAPYEATSSILADQPSLTNAGAHV